MWKLEQIQANNLCAFQNLSYSIKHNKTTLIFGNNLDNDSQASNGSGKSALIEAIAIALTGSPLRKVSADEIINDSEDEALITAYLSNDVLEEKITICRALSRKQPQSIQIFQQIGDKSEEIVQSSVADYNKYILDLLGLTKDDIYSNFILSKHKYTSFLSSSDKDKKEIINRFSNGILVDESLAALQADIIPVQDELKEAEGRVSMASGKVSAINEQIATEIAEATEKSQNKSKRIADLKDKIASKREYIREQNEIKRKVNARWDVLEDVDKQVQDYEKSDIDIVGAQQAIDKLFKENDLEEIQDFVSTIAFLHEELGELDKQQVQLSKDSKAKEAELKKIQKQYDEIKAKYDSFSISYDSQSSLLKEEMKGLAKNIEELMQEQATLQHTRQDVEKSIANLQAKLAGVIVCPKCKHEFTLADDIDIEDVRNQIHVNKEQVNDIKTIYSNNIQKIESLNDQGQKKRKMYDKLGEDKTAIATKVTEAQVAVNSCQTAISHISSNLMSLTSQIERIRKTIEGTRTDLFDQAFDVIDVAIKKCESTINNADISIENANGAIASYEESIKEIEESSTTDLIDNLKASKARYEQEFNKAMSEQEDINKQLAAYKTQEATFIEFKTHLANTKINDLSRITNEFLERIGSDIRISFSGYTVLKSGKVRDKISISLIRDGVDCGSFDKFSEGEKARVNLANILAMHKLTNVNCLDGKGLDLLVLDEILDATDESGLANIFEALNSLQITSLVVSHGNIAENYPYKLVVNKQNGVSFINESV